MFTSVVRWVLVACLGSIGLFTLAVTVLLVSAQLESIHTEIWSVLGEVGVFISGIAIVFSAIAGWAVYYTTRDGVKFRTTFQQIAQQVSDKDLLAATDRFRDIRRRHHGKKLTYQLIQDAWESAGTDCANDTDKSDADRIIQLLNYYESWAIGIEHKALCPRMLYSWWRGTFIQDWLDLQHFVEEYRDTHKIPLAFVKAQILADTWAMPEERNLMSVGLPKHDRARRAQKRLSKLAKVS